ncbi:hypothetical protein T12_16759 [Trichinella patagoniensis]|uniref:Uncharacterized protein n=1 Tax=Trichinella patagoniensis TaxID=990121 RepID=A0A0V0Z2L4_9BILA|nr:hypothetical protein T12_16759 [Trichinella patagoniensis]
MEQVSPYKLFDVSKDSNKYHALAQYSDMNWVAKVVDIDPLGSMGLSKGSIKA